MAQSKNPKFYVCTKYGLDYEYRHLQIDRKIQQDLVNAFSEQLEHFLHEKSFIKFDGGYNPNDDELLEISDYTLPTEIQEILDSNIRLESLQANELESRILRAIFAVLTYKRKTVIAFQGLTRAKVILPKRLNFVLTNNTLQRLVDPGVMLYERLTAIYMDGNLYFQSYRATQGFLDLTDYFREASDGEIKKFLRKAPLDINDMELFQKNLDSWSRKKLYSIQKSGALDKIGVSKISKVAKSYNLNVQMKGKGKEQKLILPDDKKELKTLIRIIDDDILDSKLTETTYVTNSKRKYQ